MRNQTPQGLGSVMSEAMIEMKRNALSANRKEPAKEENPQRAFQNFKSGILEIVSPEVAREHFSLFDYEKLGARKLTIRIKSTLNYEFMQQEGKGLIKSLFNTQLSHLADSIGFVIEKPQKAMIDKGKSEQHLYKALTEARKQHKLNGGVDGTARELLGVLYNFWKNKTNKSVKAVYLPNADGVNELHFRLITNYAGFVKLHVSKIDKRTFKEHVRRLMKVGILLEQPDYIGSHRTKTVAIIFNPKIIEWKY